MQGLIELHGWTWLAPPVHKMNLEVSKSALSKFFQEARTPSQKQCQERIVWGNRLRGWVHLPRTQYCVPVALALRDLFSFGMLILSGPFCVGVLNLKYFKFARIQDTRLTADGAVYWGSVQVCSLQGPAWALLKQGFWPNSATTSMLSLQHLEDCPSEAYRQRERTAGTGIRYIR